MKGKITMDQNEHKRHLGLEVNVSGRLSTAERNRAAWDGAKAGPGAHGAQQCC